MSVTSGEYAIELAAYNRGDRSDPPCERCYGPVRNGGLTGATVCDDCERDDEDG